MADSQGAANLNLWGTVSRDADQFVKWQIMGWQSR